MISIGVTERGDPSIDKSWLSSMHLVDGVVLITKNLTNPIFQDDILRNKNKIILHATCTGMGGTVHEPNVPNYKLQLQALEKLIQDGFPVSQVVLRVDPIIYELMDKYISPVFEYVDQSPILSRIPRLRWSSLDNYYHIRSRVNPYSDPELMCYFKRSDIHDTSCHIECIDEFLRNNSPIRNVYTCGEPIGRMKSSFFSILGVGCISKSDLDILKINYKEEEIDPSGRQRSACHCLSCKTELLSSKYRCPHQCIYCYWKDK